jgi:MerR family transcriptional regulator/heat shock protein HspR
MYQKPRARVDDRTGISSQPPPVRPEHASLARPDAEQPPRQASGGGDTEDWVVRMEGVYIISVAARILDMHPQTLRKYERMGLINPGRTIGMLRLYSREDIRRVRLIRHLGNMGLNLAGVEFALALIENLLRLEQRLLTFTEGNPLSSVIEQEITNVFRSLNLPVDD